MISTHLATYKIKRIVAAYLILSFAFNLFFPTLVLAASDDLVSPSLEVSSNVDGANVYVNGEMLGQTPLPQNYILNPGFYRIKVEKKGHSTWREDVILSPGEDKVVNALIVPLGEISEKPMPVEKKPITRRWWFWTLVLVGIGMAIGGSSSGSSDDGGAGQER